MGELPNYEWYRQRLWGLDDSTLKVLAESDSRITSSVGGDEVSVDDFFRPLTQTDCKIE